MPIIFKGSGNKKPKLYKKNITPRTYSTTYTPDDGYDGFSEVRVYGYNKYYTDGNASASDVRSGKTFYSGGSQKTGSMSDVTLPAPSVDYKFSSDNTQITLDIYYTPPSKGYNASTSKRTTTTDIALPETGITIPEYRTGTLSCSTVFQNGVYYNSICTIPNVSGKTLKYVYIAYSSTSYTTNGDYVALNISANLTNEYTFGVSYMNLGDSSSDGNFAYYAEYSASTSDNIIINSNNGYSIMLKQSDYSAYSQYKYIAIYE